MTTINKFPEYATKEQVAQLNKIYNSDYTKYSLSDMFNMLPKEYVGYDGTKGYLSVDFHGIHYISLNNNFKTNVVKSIAMIEDDKNIFDIWIEIAMDINK